MDINKVIYSLKQRVGDCLNDKHQDVILTLDIGSENYDKLVVSWDNAPLLDGNEYKFKLRFSTVSLFDERFPIIIIPSALEKCEIINVETLEVFELSGSDIDLSNKDLNTFTSLFKLYLAQQQLLAGEVVQPFTIA